MEQSAFSSTESSQEKSSENEISWMSWWLYHDLPTQNAAQRMLGSPNMAVRTLSSITSPNWPVTVNFPQPLLREASTNSSWPSAKWYIIRNKTVIISIYFNDLPGAWSLSQMLHVWNVYHEFKPIVGKYSIHVANGSGVKEFENNFWKLQKTLNTNI